jgi:hypothetical protein
MLEQVLVHAVIDEAGDTGRGSRSSSILVVAGVVCTRLESLERVVFHTRKGFDKKLRQIPELKASQTPAQDCQQTSPGRGGAGHRGLRCGCG